jgi:uncharacterized hydrophobic protein (TIGR00271 family)
VSDQRTPDPSNELSAAIDLSNPEFQDYDGTLFPEAPQYDLSRLWSQASLRGLAAVAIALVLITAPSTSPRLLAVVIAIVLVAWSVGGTIDLIKGKDRSLFSTAKVILAVGIAITVLVWPRITVEALGRLVGVALIVAGSSTLYKAFQDRHERSVIESGIGALLYVALGIALVISPGTLIKFALLGLAIYWFIAGVLTVITNVRADDTEIRPTETWQSFLMWVQSRPNTVDDRQQLYSKIFYEGEEGPRRLSRFFALMAFATTIAFFGIVGDSTAVVIGAMLVAPLMTPLMGTSLAMVMGWPRRVTITGLVALSGIALTIGLSILFGWIVGFEISSELNTQVASRIQPTLIDLMIAIAAGGAGAFAMSRPDVSDSLPGVAVAIALVPPLAVVGLMISQNEWSEALGAMLLFTTNLVAILLVGALVFVMTGVVPMFQLTQNSKRIRLSLGMAAILAVLVVAVLGVSTESFNAEIAGTKSANEAVDQWLEGTEMTAISVIAGTSEVVVIVTGPDEPPPVEELASSLEEELGETIDVEVNWIPRTTYEFTTPD